MLGAFVQLMLQKSIGPGQPATGLREIPLEQQGERHPEHAPRGPPGMTAFDIGSVSALQRLPALVHVAE